MLGRCVGPRPVPEKREERFGEVASACSPAQELQLGCNVVEPDETSPSYAADHERFQTDAAAAEYERRQQQAARKQVAFLAKSRLCLCREVGRASF